MKSQKFSISDILNRSPSVPNIKDKMTVIKSETDNNVQYIPSLPTPTRSPEPELCVSKQSHSLPIKDTPKRDTLGAIRKRDPIGQILDSLCSNAEKKASVGPSAFSPIITSSCSSQLSPISLLAQCDRRCLQMSPNLMSSPFCQTPVRNDVIPPVQSIEQLQYIHAQQIAQQQQKHQQQQIQQQQMSMNGGLYPLRLSNNGGPPTMDQLQLLHQQQAQIMAMERYSSTILANRNCSIGNSLPVNTASPYWMAWFKSSGGEAMSSLPVKDSRIPAPPRYQCDACKKSYSTFGGLSKHKQFHCVSHVKKEFNCKYCEKSYGSLGALKMHIRTHTLPCKCKLCGKAFSRPWLLQGHLRTHTGEKPFKCAHCGRSFADRSNLRAHLQTHSDIKKYGCKNCTKTFSRMSLLLKHEEGSCLGLRR